MKARDNPFATERLERLLAFDPELNATSWPQIEARWEQLGRRACVRGRHGAGKTTFLTTFGGRLSKEHRVLYLFFNKARARLHAADRALLKSSAEAVLLIDGDQHLPLLERFELRQAASHAHGVLWTRHRAGLSPSLLHLKIDQVLAQRLLQRVAPEWSAVLEPKLPKLLKEVRGNLRELWMAYYDQLATGEIKI